MSKTCHVKSTESFIIQEQKTDEEIMSHSTSKSEISSSNGLKHEEQTIEQEFHVEERNSTVIFNQQTDETHRSIDVKIEKPTNLDIVPVIVGDEKQLPVSQSIAELNANEQNSQVEFNVVLCEPAEFVKCIEKLIHSTQTVEKHLDNIQKTNREFYEFEKQEIKLNAIKQTLESLAMALRTSLVHKKAILDKSNKETSKNITSSIVTLTKQHHNVVQKYKDKNALYMKNYDKWSDFNKNFVKIQNWIDSTLNKLNELNESILDTERVQEIIKV